jgi:hypothetical protein
MKIVCILFWPTYYAPIFRSRSFGLLLPFYVEPTVLGAIRRAVASGEAVDLTGWSKEKAVNAFANTTVSSIVIEVPDGTFGVATIGFWGVTALGTDAGGWRQINREGQPVIQPIFNPDDSERSSAYNTTQPREDRAIHGPLVSKLVAGVVTAMGTSAEPQVYGISVAKICFPDILPYEIGTPAVFGFAWRNGRALADNAQEVMFSIVINAALSDGLNLGTATGSFAMTSPMLRCRRSPPRSARHLHDDIIPCITLDENHTLGRPISRGRAVRATQLESLTTIGLAAAKRQPKSRLSIASPSICISSLSSFESKICIFENS